MLCGSHSRCSSVVGVCAPGALLSAQHCCSLSPALLALPHRDLGCTLGFMAGMRAASEGEDPWIIILPAQAKAQPSPCALHLLHDHSTWSIAILVSLHPCLGTSGCLVLGLMLPV